MTKKERDTFVLKGLQSFALLDRTNTDEIGWTALRLGCSRKQAAKAIESARESAESGS